MTASRIPSQAWGTAFVDQVELTTEQQYGCATCGQVTQVIIMKQGTIYCKDHGATA